MKIAISSGKGGTGKTFISTNLAVTLARIYNDVQYLDCDVEEPNGHLFLKPLIEKEEDVTILAPSEVDEKKCISCGKCVESCSYNAIALVKDKILFFNELCHVCGACEIVCPTGAIIEKERKIGVVRHGKSGKIDFHYALLETAEGGMSPRLVKKVRELTGKGITLLDSSPGTACPVVETIKDVDLCVLVTDPTPFGVNDLKLAVSMAREIGTEPVIVVNRAEYRDDTLKNYCTAERLEIIGEIPDDREIAEIYSVGDIVVEKLPRYRGLFEDLASRIITMAGQKRTVKKSVIKEVFAEEKGIEKSRQDISPGVKKPKELVIISGKGGTGKTSITASFAALAENTVISDCDVDAADLHLILTPRIKERGAFSGGVHVEINQDKCSACGKCYEACRFSAIKKQVVSGAFRFSVDPLACEGCGTCLLVCEDNAIEREDAINGHWFISDTRFGPMAHAKLGVAEENSGRLVTLVRNKETRVAYESGRDRALIDGSPGTGCPVIASLSGADYALIVTEPTVSGIHDMRRILDVTAYFKIPSGVLVNKYDLNVEMTEKIKELSKEYNAEFVGVIQYDTKITEAQMKKLSVVEYAPDAPVSKSIEQIWQKINEII
ncbi:MAG: P-loop NTPase [Candidatus Theseobacter exili]|nr:P-loop NTPase [Candidatus Theseobacter exili]